ncbi:YpjP family protein [Sporosarcina sp. FA9]|uniref:YpjP family protein n=1 Tax=Sporosarcina sp. FA9 TaxID=3413030 RepID=UPI003F65DA7B
MKKWLQKSLIASVALLTFGVINPGHEIWTLLQDKDDAKQMDASRFEQTYDIDFTETKPLDPVESIEEYLISSARDLSFMKFGSRIGPVISDEFNEVIFPKIDEAIRMTLRESDDLHKRRISISEKPAGDYSEKVFHIYDMDRRKDIIRFHVRTEKRPQDGFFFNFHYHISDDNFVAHHTIGDIYWSKNTPPKWLS